MNTPEYNAHRDEKISRYRARGEALWELEAFRASMILVAPPKAVYK